MSGELYRSRFRFTAAVLGMSVLLATVFLIHTITVLFAPLQRQYLLTYLLTTRGGAGKYGVLLIKHPKGTYWATDRDVAVIPPDSSPATDMRYELTATARNWGAQWLEWVDAKTDRAELHRTLQRLIYEGRTVWDLARPSILEGLAVLILLPWAIAADRRNFRQLRKGVVRKGPVKVRRAEFNERIGSDGIGIMTTEPPTIWDRLRKTTAQPPIVRIARHDEAGHILLVGDSGSGKSSVIRQMLRQIRERGETAVVYDPELDFTPEFYDPARGDFICNPIDARMPYWSITDEASFPPEASALADSFFPDGQGSAESIATAREVFVHLLQHYRPSTEELAAWLSDLKEVENRIANTPLARLLGECRQSVEALFQRIAGILQPLPRENECPRRWSAASWALERQGWLFFPVRPGVRETTCALVRLWLDAVLLNLVASAEAGAVPVWIILDDAGSIESLTQLHAVATRARKANIRLVLGVRNRAQLVARYGTVDAERILNQPLTKIFLRSSEPQTAKWMSEVIGEVEIERLVEDEGFERSWRHWKTFHLERRIEPLVLASEIQGLPDGTGFLKCRNLVVPLKLPWIGAERKERGYIPKRIDGSPPTRPPGASAPTLPVAPGGQPIFD